MTQRLWASNRVRGAIDVNGVASNTLQSLPCWFRSQTEPSTRFVDNPVPRRGKTHTNARITVGSWNRLQRTESCIDSILLSV